MTEPVRRVSLVLGAGGARGYAHIGAIEELTARGYEIVAVAGASMGALVGGLHAAGRLQEFAEWAVGLSRGDVLRLVDVAVRAPGLARAERVMREIRGLRRRAHRGPRRAVHRGRHRPDRSPRGVVPARASRRREPPTPPPPPPVEPDLDVGMDFGM